MNTSRENGSADSIWIETSSKEELHDVPMPSVLRYVPRPFRWDNAPIEASGLSLDAYARGSVFMSSLFLGPALLLLASEAAGCDSGKTCDAKVYGFRASSLLSNIAIVAGFLSSICLPLFGAIVDHTRYRKQVGAFTALGLAIVKGVEVVVGKNTWFYIGWLQVLSSLLYGVHTTATYAYTSELTNDTSRLATYNTYFYMVVYVATIAFMIEVLTLAHFLKTEDIGTARISQIISSGTSALFFYFAWTFLFRDRPPLSHIPDGDSLLTCGFRKIFKTAASIKQQYSALKWLMISIIFAEASTSALVTIATTYMTKVLEMDSSEIGLVFFVVLVMGIPGSKMAGRLAISFQNPITSAKLCDIFFIITTTFASMVLTGPEEKHMTIIFAALWGIALGWLSPMHTTAFISLIPKGSEAELMGIYLLCVNILSWLPPLLFTILNELGFPMAFGLWSLCIFMLIGLTCLFVVGDYDKAIDEVRHTSPELELNRHEEVPVEARDIL